jgi:hypothetical protein
MLTHTIKISKDVQYPVVYRPGGYQPIPQFGSKQQVNNQNELDEYLKTNPWIKKDTFLTFGHHSSVSDLTSVHFIADVITDFDQLLKPTQYTRDLPPRLMRVVCCNINEHGLSTWDRMDNISGFRVMQQDEIDRIVNDHVRNRIQLWKEQNGYKKDQPSQDNGT